MRATLTNMLTKYMNELDLSQQKIYKSLQTNTNLSGSQEID